MAYAIQNLLDEQPNPAEEDRRPLEEQQSSLLEVPTNVRVGTRRQRAMETLKRVAPKVWDKADIAAPLLTSEVKAERGRLSDRDAL